MSRSKEEEVIGILWLILAATIADKSTAVAVAAAVLGALALVAAIVFAWSDRLSAKASQ